MTAQKTRLYHRLQVAAHRIQKAADRAVIAAAEVTTAQAAVLAVIARSEPTSQRLVANQLGLNESAVTAMCARLIEKGLLDRTPDPSDTRAWSLSLSAKGRAALKRLERPFRGINDTIEATLSEREILHLADYLTRLGQAFE